MKFNKAFTLIELLVAIAVMGILLSIISVSYSKSQLTGRDTKRISDMVEIAAALRDYRSEKGSYPEENPSLAVSGNSDGFEVSTSSGFLSKLVSSGYLKQVPTDPKNSISGTSPFIDRSKTYVYAYKFFNTEAEYTGANACGTDGPYAILAFTTAEAEKNKSITNVVCSGGKNYSDKFDYAILLPL